MRYLLLSLLFFFSACATIPREGLGGYPSRYIDIDTFCKKYNLEYKPGTTKNTFILFSERTKLKLSLNSPYFSYNGKPHFLRSAPFYKEDKIYIPEELARKVFLDFIPSHPFFEIKTIVVDPGHGGRDPGAISFSGLKEKELNLKVARHLKEILERNGFKVILTRSKDIYLSLQKRVEIAKKYDADLFVSVHANANRSRYIDGVEVYYLSPFRFDSHRRAISLAKDDFFKKDLDPEVRTILWDLSLTKSYMLSVDLARQIYYSFRRLGFATEPPKRANFYVLRLAYVPSILVEIGYLTNRLEEKKLRKPSYQKRIAEAIALGIIGLHGQHTSFRVK